MTVPDKAHYQQPTYRITDADNRAPLVVVCDLCGWSYRRTDGDPYADNLAAACHRHTVEAHPRWGGKVNDES